MVTVTRTSVMNPIDHYPAKFIIETDFDGGVYKNGRQIDDGHPCWGAAEYVAKVISQRNYDNEKLTRTQQEELMELCGRCFPDVALVWNAHPLSDYILIEFYPLQPVVFIEDIFKSGQWTTVHINSTNEDGEM